MANRARTDVQLLRSFGQTQKPGSGLEARSALSGGILYMKKSHLSGEIISFVDPERKEDIAGAAMSQK
jgi:hypothetical protein